MKGLNILTATDVTMYVVPGEKYITMLVVHGHAFLYILTLSTRVTHWSVVDNFSMPHYDDNGLRKNTTRILSH